MECMSTSAGWQEAVDSVSLEMAVSHLNVVVGS